EPHFERVIAVRARLVRDHPRVAGYRIVLAEDYLNLGLVWANTGRQTRAAEAYEKAAGLLRPLLKELPEPSRVRLSLAAALINWAPLLRDQGKSKAALLLHDEAVALAETELRREPGDGRARHLSRNAHGMRAQTYQQLGRWADAVRDWTRVIELSSA